ncbi:DNA repair and recombination protein rad54b [Cichlidogyrus casuarinus]|uniref:DNA repair and recombination protein rad54b n=1 Tax=Cichlidogyrus casuarinus TaxID=1844966 RepID=A0ABD2PY57_9PLAT
MLSSQLEDIDEGSILSVGSYEAHLITLISALPQPSNSKNSQPLKPADQNVSLPPKLLPFVSKKTIKKTSDLLMKDALPMPPPSELYLMNRMELDAALPVYLDANLTSQLKPHQKEGVSFMYQALMGYKYLSENEIYGTLLCDEMGLGKTLQAICTAWIFLKQNPFSARKPLVKRVLVVVPGSNWQKEFYRWIGRERLQVYCVDKDHSLDKYVNSCLAKIVIAPVLIISYEMLVQNSDLVSKIDGIDLLICDEAHRLKNANTKTVQVLETLRIPRRLLLTGTPIQNDLSELWTLAQFCAPGALGSKTRFLKSLSGDSVLDQIMKGDLTHSDEEFSQLLSKFFLRRTSSLYTTHLPTKRENVVFCSLSEVQSRLQCAIYKWAETQFQVTKKISIEEEPSSPCLSDYASDSELEEDYVSGAGSAALLSALSGLRLMYNDPNLLLDKLPSSDSLPKDLKSKLEACFCEHQTDDWARSGKLSLLRHMLSSLFSNCRPDDRIVLVSSFTKTLDVLERLVRECHEEACPSGSREGLMVRIDGASSVSKRQSVVEAFNCKQKGFRLLGPRVMLLSTKAGGVGLNLIGASYLVLFDQDWNPANDEQAVARIWREGQKRDCFIYRLVIANSLEERMFQRQIAKCGLSARVTNTSAKKRKSAANLSSDELRRLFQLPDHDKNWTHELIRCQCMIGGENRQEDSDEERECQISIPDASEPDQGSSLSKIDTWLHLLSTEPISQYLGKDPLLKDISEGMPSFPPAIFTWSTSDS